MQFELRHLSSHRQHKMFFALHVSKFALHESWDVSHRIFNSWTTHILSQLLTQSKYSFQKFRQFSLNHYWMENLNFFSDSDDDVITDSSGDLRVITRKEWLAEPPSSELDKLNLPVSRVIIAHTATDNCTTLVFENQISMLTIF